MGDEAFAVAVNADCNTRLVEVSHSDFAEMAQVPGSLGPFARSSDVVVLGPQIAQVEAR